MDEADPKGVGCNMSLDETIIATNSQTAIKASPTNLFFGQEARDSHPKIFPGNMFRTPGRHPQREHGPYDFPRDCVSPRARFEQDLKELHSACTLIDKLGSGSYGSVYKCKAKYAEQVRAVKVYNPKSKLVLAQTLRRARERL